jgi:hypothetical protein
VGIPAWRPLGRAAVLRPPIERGTRPAFPAGRVLSRQCTKDASTTIAARTSSARTKNLEGPAELAVTVNLAVGVAVVELTCHGEASSPHPVQDGYVTILARSAAVGEWPARWPSGPRHISWGLRLT